MREIRGQLACMDHWLFLCLAAFVMVVSSSITLAGAEAVGVNYGLLADNLPSPDVVVALYRSKNITKLRLFDPNPDALRALRGSGIEVVLGTFNQDIQMLSADPSYAAYWVSTNVVPYKNCIRFRYISAGNEVIPGDLAVYVLPAMRNLDVALRAANITVPVTTTVGTSVLGASFPPSQGAFSDSARAFMVPIVGYLEATKTPLLINVYPYFAYMSDPQNVRLDYALFTAPGVVVWDSQLGYANLFDAMVDAVYSAAEKAGAPGLALVVSETGWPSEGGGIGATVDNAMTYNNNAVAHVASNAGTPRRPGKEIETYLFALFNENLKPQGIEQNFGLYYPDMTEVYHLVVSF